MRIKDHAANKIYIHSEIDIVERIKLGPGPGEQPLRPDIQVI